MTRFKYSVTYWDCTDQREKNAHGYVCGVDISDAIENIHKYYGYEAVNRYYIEPDCDDTVIELGDDEEFNVNWQGPATNEGF